MQNHGFTEADWKLFRKKLPGWQERYMEKLIEEYKAILATDEPASEKFWSLEKRIKEDKKDTGVLARDVSRSNMQFLMMDLLNEGAISEADLEGFKGIVDDSFHDENDANVVIRLLLLWKEIDSMIQSFEQEIQQIKLFDY